jgi:hypothetical protein
MTPMLVKKVVIDKANRLYQLPPDIQSFIPAEPRRSLVLFRMACGRRA